MLYGLLRHCPCLGPRVTVAVLQPAATLRVKQAVAVGNRGVREEVAGLGCPAVGFAITNDGVGAEVAIQTRRQMTIRVRTVLPREEQNQRCRAWRRCRCWGRA